MAEQHSRGVYMSGRHENGLMVDTSPYGNGDEFFEAFHGFRKQLGRRAFKAFLKDSVHRAMLAEEGVGDYLDFGGVGVVS